MRKRAQRHRSPARAPHVDVPQEQGILPELRRGLHDDVILIQRRVHGRDLPLPEGVVQRGVDQLRRNAEPRGRLAIVLQQRLHAPVLLVAAEVGDQRHRPQFPEHGRRVPRQVGQVIAPHRELVLSVAHASTDANVLPGLQVQSRPGHPRQLWPQPGDDVIGRDPAFRQRLQRHEHAGRVYDASACETVHHVDGRIGGHDIDHPPQDAVHRLEGGVLVGHDGAHQPPVILLREEALGHMNVQIEIQYDGREQNHQRDERVP